MSHDPHLKKSVFPRRTPFETTVLVVLFLIALAAVSMLHATMKS